MSNFTPKRISMNYIQQIQTIVILPEKRYSVKEACIFLGIHRCTIYDYIRHEERPLPFIRIHTDKRGIVFQGSDLLAYKAAGLPKKGRKFKDSTSR